MELRRARWGDFGVLLRWRQQGEQAPHYHGQKTEWAHHYQWLQPRVQNTSLCRIWVAEHNGEPVGTVRLDSNGELSFTVPEEHQGNGYEEQLVRWAVENSQMPRVKASIDGDNPALAAALEATGFQEHPDVRFFLWKPST